MTGVNDKRKSYKGRDLSVKDGTAWEKPQFRNTPSCSHGKFNLLYFKNKKGVTCKTQLKMVKFKRKFCLREALAAKLSADLREQSTSEVRNQVIKQG